MEMALISGVMPRRRRDQISSGRVLSRPMRKKLTAISSSESVKISKAGSDQRDAEVRKRDAPEGFPMIRAEIERGFFLRAIELLQACKYFGGSDGYQRGAVAERDGDEAEFHADCPTKSMSRESPVMIPGRISGSKDEAAKKGLARELSAVESECCGKTESERDSDGNNGNDQAIENGSPTDRSRPKKLAVPVERPAVRRKAADAGAVEGIDDEYDDRKIEKCVHEGGVRREKGCAAGS